MDDLISRQAAITLPIMPKEYRKHKPIDCEDAYEQGWSDCQSCIGHLPAAEKKGKWIPVSEKPEKDGRYQVTRHDYVTNTEFIDILWYEENLWWNGHSTGDYAVIAWMPLPEPYCGARMEE